MIHREQTIGLLLEACPSYRARWMAYQASPDFDAELLYVHLGDFAAHVVDLLGLDDKTEIASIAEACEQLHLDGDDYVKEAATIGLLEGIQSVAGHRDVATESLEAALGPEARRWWRSLDACQQRLEADADLATLDARCLSLVRWADRKGMTDLTPIDLGQYRRVVVMTGAGISVASGLPTYRGTGGLWDKVDVRGHATAAAIQADPARVRNFFAEGSAHMRPAVVLFDEPLSVDAEWESKKALRDCDLFLAVGTSGTVSPASNFVRAAEYAGARTVYVNLEPMTPMNPAFREVVLGPADELLPQLLGSADDMPGA